MSRIVDDIINRFGGRLPPPAQFWSEAEKEYLEYFVRCFALNLVKLVADMMDTGVPFTQAVGNALKHIGKYMATGEFEYYYLKLAREHRLRRKGQAG